MSPDITATIKEFLDTAGIGYTDVTESMLAGQTIYSIKITEPLQAVVGAHHSDTIHALDLLIKKMLEKRLSPDQGSKRGGEDHSMFLIDINDHRTKQIKDLQTKALMMADRARSLQYDVELTPMSAYERLIVHTTLADAEHVKTESLGEGYGRRVVIKYLA